MFLGTHVQRTDAKSRVSVPAAFRRQLDGGGDFRLVLVRSLTDACITAYPMAKWEQRVAAVSALPQSHPVVSVVKKLQFGCAAEVTPDGHGRILLPQELRDHASISASSELAAVGQGDTFDLYEVAHWRAESAAAAAQLPDLRAALAELGL
ncbi:MAG: division/cell wall cluster transcriptional repressor MraZ [Myxococcales bacterium]|nr:division/cell wall cluster transcriptional repressor MraZ [Myxococcales bacterium]